jgi:NitT/TauT family transport system substrate-binding protein
MSGTGKRKLTIESVEPVFGLHWFVGVEDGLFAEEGLDVEIVHPKVPERFGRDDPRRYDHHKVASFNYQNMFEQYQCDIYRACEWGQVRRTYDQKRPGPIVGKRAAVVCQGIYVRDDSPINAPGELANKEVGVQFHQGSHYTSLALLEGVLRRDEIKLVHAGVGWQRFEALEKGEVAAACLVAPYNTLAEKRGYKRLGEMHYLGLENFAADLDEETVQALNRAIRNAVRNINADKKRYIHILLQEMPEKYRSEITADDFYLPRLRYVDPSPYTREEFEHTAEWMKKWDLIPKDATFEKLVVNREYQAA